MYAHWVLFFWIDSDFRKYARRTKKKKKCDYNEYSNKNIDKLERNAK